MKKQKNQHKHFPLIITIILFLIIILQLIYYFNPQFRFFSAKKSGETTQSGIDALKLKGWTEQVKFLENIIIGNGILKLDNTFGHVTSGNFSYVNKMDRIQVGSNFQADIRLKKIKGKTMSFNFLTSLPENTNDWWTIRNGLELIVDENTLYVKLVGSKKNVSEIFHIGEVPQSGKILIDFSGKFISVKDEYDSAIGTAIFEEDPFEGEKEIYLGLTVGADGIAEISKFTLMSNND